MVRGNRSRDPGAEEAESDTELMSKQLLSPAMTLNLEQLDPESGDETAAQFLLGPVFEAISITNIFLDIGIVWLRTICWTLVTFCYEHFVGHW